MNGPWCKVEFCLLDWEAWAPGLADKGSWAAWSASGDPWPRDDSGTPAVAAMPAALRRRAGRNDRLGLEPAWRLAPQGVDGSSIFASRHGQVARSAQLLEALAQGTPLSPMDFSLSVHNACSGLFSIARGDRSASTALAAQGEELAAAMLEAAGQLLEGGAAALVVAHDEPPPPIYDAHWVREDGSGGLALRLAAQGGRRLSLALGPWDGPDRGRAQWMELAALLAAGAGSARWARQGRAWVWELDA